MTLQVVHPRSITRQFPPAGTGQRRGERQRRDVRNLRTARIDEDQAPCKRARGLQMLHFGARALHIAAAAREVSDQALGVIVGEYRDAKHPVVAQPVEHLEQIHALAIATAYDPIGEAEMIVYCKLDDEGISPGRNVLADVEILADIH